MKRLTGQAWFVPAVIAVAIVGTLALYRNRDGLFGSSNKYGMNYVSIEKAREMMEEPDKIDGGNFVLVYGRESCGACTSMYAEIKDFREAKSDAANKFKFYNIDTDATEDKGTNFWRDYFTNNTNYTWGSASAEKDKFGDSPSTPSSILVVGGVIEKYFTGSTGALTIVDVLSKY